jgi:ribulose-5-phosphate 4-epimerase/fuculose-1-phosphate aldolase
MNELLEYWRELVVANRILAREGVVDAYGHVSVRHPDDPQRYLMSRSRSPELVTLDDIMEFTLDGQPIDGRDRSVYAERFIHAGVYEARPDVKSVVHSHAYEVIPFGVTATPIRPLLHTASRIGAEVPTWDIRDRFGDTNLLVVNMGQARDLARSLGNRAAALMRGHGCVVCGSSVRQAVMTAIYLRINARLQMQAMRMGEVRYLSPGEIAARENSGDVGFVRSWEYLRVRAGCTDL